MIKYRYYEYIDMYTSMRGRIFCLEKLFEKKKQKQIES